MKRSNKIFQEFENPVILDIKTKCPEKWILIDRETGETYQGNKNGYWDKLKINKK